MLFSEHLSPIFSNKSKFSGEIVDRRDDPNEGGATETPYDIIEHDITTLAKSTNLPPPDSFDALQVGTER